MQTHIASDLVFIVVNVQVFSVGCGGDDDEVRGWCKTHRTVPCLQLVSSSNRNIFSGRLLETQSYRML